MSRPLLLVSTLDGSGPGRVMATLAQQLVCMGQEPVLASTHGVETSSLIREASESGVPVEHLRMHGMVDPAGAARMAGLLRRWRPSVVHTRTIRADLIGRIAAGYGVPVINNVVNLYPDDCLVRLGPAAGRGAMLLARSTRGAVRLFVANAEAVASNTGAAFGVPPERIRVVYDGLDLGAWAGGTPTDLSGYGISPEHTVCLTVARLHAQKGLEDLVEAARSIHDQRSEVVFVVAGGGPERANLTRLIRSAGLEDVVFLVGERDDISNLLARSRLFVLPSLFEGLPSAIIEAMGAGRAVVATRVAGVPELVVENETGWMVPPASPQLLASAILRALSADLESVGEVGRNRALRYFSAAAMGRDFEELYGEVGNHRRTGPVSAVVKPTLKGATPTTPRTAPSTFLITTRNRPQELRRLIESILGQSVLPQEIVLVDASDVPDEGGLRERIESAGVDFVFLTSKPGRTHQLNIGIDASSGDIVLINDDDVVLEQRYHEAMLSVFEQGGASVGGVQGTIIGDTLKPLPMRAFRALFLLSRHTKDAPGRLLPSGYYTTPVRPTRLREAEALRLCGLAFRRGVFADHRFDETLEGYALKEDIDLSYRVSRRYKLFVTPDARFHHLKSPGARISVRQKSRMHVINNYRIHRRNLKHTPASGIAFAWAVLGRVLQELGRAVAEMNPGYILGTLQGLWDIAGSTKEAFRAR
ncbi:MAG: glycosyltransferase [Actinobacteria bacterium]|nr:glycosyltransferase [Actinomycetota bacterium]